MNLSLKGILALHGPIDEKHRGILYIKIDWQSNLKDKQMY